MLELSTRMAGLRWEKLTLAQSITALAELNSPERCKSALDTAIQLVESALSDPSRFASVKSESKTLRTRILDLSGGAAFFEGVGFSKADGPFVLDTSVGETELWSRVRVIKQARARVEGVLAAIVAVGDQNAPAAALAAVKLAQIYMKNILGSPTDASKRRVSASNKALSSRLLGAAGGPELLGAVGFEPQPDDIYVCVPSNDELHVAANTLDHAETVWAQLAGAAGVDPSAASRSPSGDASQVADPIALDAIVVSRLLLASSLAQRRGTADLEPALVSDESRSAVLLFCWMGVTRKWRQFARMQTPSTTVEWDRPEAEGTRYELIIEVDLGDGKPLELGCHVQDGQPENEYVAANRFIGQHFESLNSNHLEEIARNVRSRVSPVLQTLKNLVAAMEAQN